MILITCLTLVLGAAPPQTHTIAVMKLRLETPIPEGVGRTLDEVLMEALAQHKSLHVIGYSDIVALVEQEANRQVLGCESNVSCLAEVGGALGASLLLDASIGAVGKEYVLNVKLLDVTSVTVLGRASETVQGDESNMIGGLRRAVMQTLKAATTSETPRGKALATSLGWQPIGKLRELAPWLGLGATSVLLGVGATYGGLARREAAEARDRVRGTPEWQRSRDATEQKALLADTLFVAGGVAALGTAALFFWNSDVAGGVITNVAPNPHGVDAHVSFTW